MALQRMSIKISEDMHEWIQSESARRGLTMNAIVIIALEHYYNQSVVMPHFNELMELEKKRQEENK